MGIKSSRLSPTISVNGITYDKDSYDKALNTYHDNISDMTWDDFTKKYNSIEDYANDFVTGYLIEDFGNNGMLSKSINEELFEKWLTHPDSYRDELADFMTYLNVSNDVVKRLTRELSSLSRLDYNVRAYDYSSEKTYDDISKAKMLIDGTQYRVKTRQLLTQGLSRGFATCIWLGQKKNPFLYIFDNDKYVYPAYIDPKSGEMLSVLDLSWFEEMKSDVEKDIMFELLSPYVTKSDFVAYQKDTNKRFVVLPQDRTYCFRTNVIFANQRIGLPEATNILNDILYKKRLKDLETSLINKIVKSVAVLTIGNDKTSYREVGSKMRNAIKNSVKMALTQANSSKNLPVAVLPETAKLEVQNVDGVETIGNSKFDNVNKDIVDSVGLLGRESTSEAVNAKRDIQRYYLETLLEQIDIVYNKLINISFPQSKGKNLIFEFNKDERISIDRKLTAIEKLSAYGFAIKPICDALGIDYHYYIKQSQFECANHREDIHPLQNSNTMSGENGAPTNSTKDTLDVIANQE